MTIKEGQEHPEEIPQEVLNPDGSPEAQQETTKADNKHGVDDDQPIQPRDQEQGMEQPLPTDVEQQQQQRPDPTAIEEDDDEATIAWKKSPFAVGRVKPKWSDEFRPDESGRPAKKGCLAVVPKMASLGCAWTERVGNMSVIYKRTPKGQDHEPPEIVVVAGPFWFVTLFVTIPLIVGISCVLFFRYIRCYNNPWLELVWGLLLATLLGCLLMASLSNPGILPRHLEPPTPDESPTDEVWTWNDQALTYRPSHAKYDPLCAVMVEGFDHTCPWVGTAIGARNMKWFKAFLLMIAVCLAYQIVLLYMADCFIGGDD